MGEFALEGAAELDDNLRFLGEQVARRIGRKSLQGGAVYVEQAIAKRIPHDEGTMEAALETRMARKSRHTRRDTITVQTGIDGKRHPELITTTEKTGTRHFYPAIVEYGTVERKAYPFMRPAWDAVKDLVLKMIMRHLKTGIESAVRRKYRAMLKRRI